jgi:hypothetical protein
MPFFLCWSPIWICGTVSKKIIPKTLSTTENLLSRKTRIHGKLRLRELAAKLIEEGKHLKRGESTFCLRNEVLL